MAFSKDETLWDEFLALWPIERLRTMTLAEYTTAGSKECFVYWIEGRLDEYGSIWGGSAFKFGIYSRNATSVEEGDGSRAYDEKYGWYRKFGDTSATAFAAVKAYVVEVAEAARAGNLEIIDSIPLGDAYRWKIAFHYQSRENPSIASIFLRKALLGFIELPQNDRKVPQSKLYRDVLKRRRNDEDIVAFSRRVWQEWARSNPYQIKLSEGAIRNGYLTVNPVSAPFPESMHGGLTDAQAGESAHFRTDTGLEFDSDLRVSSSGSGRIRNRLNAYLASIGAKPGDSLYVIPFEEGKYFIARDAQLPVSVTKKEPVVPKAMPTHALVAAKSALNRVLYGPPGTGKTYQAIEEAVEILDPVFAREQVADRAALKARYDTLVREGLIHFVTFHQSFSYEDFVEGLRAEADEESGALRYEVADGVFKRFCDAARTRLVKESAVPMDLKGRRIWKISLGDYSTEGHIYEECIEKGIALIGFGGGADFSACASREDIQRVFASVGEHVALGDYPVIAVNTFVRQIRKGDLVVVTEGNLKFRAIGEVTGDYRRIPREGDTYAQCRDVRWLRVYKPALPYESLMENRFSQMTIYELRSGSIDLEKLNGLLAPKKDQTAESRARVLIIDEINRGNVSRIFGELITLIEPSKRAGAEEALEVVLPYSKKSFSVPENVYLVGTMNTADRSLAGLDIALRRRFQFIEMPARADFLAGVEVEGVDIEELLTIMNRRIEALLDRDHCLGHAYFMPLLQDESLSRLASIFRGQVLPLLQEYFFEDWERIRWVLNDQNKAEGHCFVVSPRYDMAGLFGQTPDVPIQTKLWELDSEAFDRRESYLGIIGV